MIEATHTVIGLLNPTKSYPAFLMPVFSGLQGDNRAYVQSLDAAGQVTGMEVIDIPDSGFRSFYSDLRTAPGAEAVWAFAFDEHEYFVDYEHRLKALLSERLRDSRLRAAPFVNLEVLDFLAMPEERSGPLREAYKQMQKVTERSAKYWRDAIVLTPLARDAVRAKLDDKRSERSGDQHLRGLQVDVINNRIQVRVPVELGARLDEPTIIRSIEQAVREVLQPLALEGHSVTLSHPSEQWSTRVTRERADILKDGLAVVSFSPNSDPYVEALARRRFQSAELFNSSTLSRFRTRTVHEVAGAVIVFPIEEAALAQSFIEECARQTPSILCVALRSGRARALSRDANAALSRLAAPTVVVETLGRPGTLNRTVSPALNRLLEIIEVRGQSSSADALIPLEAPYVSVLCPVYGNGSLQRSEAVCRAFASAIRSGLDPDRRADIYVVGSSRAGMEQDSFVQTAQTLFPRAGLHEIIRTSENAFKDGSNVSVFLEGNSEGRAFRQHFDKFCERLLLAQGWRSEPLPAAAVGLADFAFSNEHVRFLVQAKYSFKKSDLQRSESSNLSRDLRAPLIFVSNLVETNGDNHDFDTGIYFTTLMELVHFSGTSRSLWPVAFAQWKRLGLSNPERLRPLVATMLQTRLVNEPERYGLWSALDELSSNTQIDDIALGDMQVKFSQGRSVVSVEGTMSISVELNYEGGEVTSRHSFPGSFRITADASSADIVVADVDTRSFYE